MFTFVWFCAPCSYRCPLRQEEGIKSSVTAITGGYVLPDAGLELRPGALQEQQALLAAELSLQQGHLLHSLVKRGVILVS